MHQNRVNPGGNSKSCSAERCPNCSFGLAKGWCRTAVSSNSTACCGTVRAAWDCTCGAFLQRATRATPGEYCGSLMQMKREKLDLIEVRHFNGHLSSEECQLMCRRKGVNPGHRNKSISCTKHQQLVRLLICKIQCQPGPTKPEGALDTKKPATFRCVGCVTGHNFSRGRT